MADGTIRLGSNRNPPLDETEKPKFQSLHTGPEELAPQTIQRKEILLKKRQ